jgi:hypothetical protein
MPAYEDLERVEDTEKNTCLIHVKYHITLLKLYSTLLKTTLE